MFVEGPDLTVEEIMMGVSSISLSWRVSGDTVIGSEVVWQAVSGPAGDRGSSDFISSTSYTIHDLQKLSVYTVTVTVRTLSSGNFSESVIAFTGYSFFSLILKVFLSIQFLHVKAVDHHH